MSTILFDKKGVWGMKARSYKRVFGIFIAALLWGVLCGGASDAAGRDPIGTRRLFPKSRLTVTAVQEGGNVITFKGQGDGSAPTDKVVLGSGSLPHPVFAQASVAAD
ncbi:MAG: hypothetical protein LBQ90_13295, partial [Synergistaceae bacterium]|nr:hypothetical protein [Synergistaceae bacterium]